MTFKNAPSHRLFEVLEDHRNNIKKGEIGYKDRGDFFVSILHLFSSYYVEGDFEVRVVNAATLTCKFVQTVKYNIQ